MWTDEQLEKWHCRKQQYFSEKISVELHKEIHQQRLLVQQEMLQVLNLFLDGAMTLKEFNQVFQQRTHEEWNVFHLRGMSGGLFLNKLVKYIPEEDTFAHLLRMMLRIPVDQQDGQRHMRALTRFLEGIIASQQATRLQLQPARVPFFLSVWWHIQEVECWPIFYLDLRHVLLSEERAVGALQDPVETYFVFKARFSDLKQVLALSAWELEQLIIWHHTNNTPILEIEASTSLSCRNSPSSHNQKEVKGNKSLITETVRFRSNSSGRGTMTYKKGQVDTNHTYIQWLLAKIGIKIGCSVWVAIDDHEKVYNEERLGDFCPSSLPILADSAFHHIIKHMDILWLRKDEVIAAFAVSLTATDISKSLLLLSDLIVLFPKRNTQLCVVTPQGCFENVNIELMHPIFYHHDMHKRSKIIIQEQLVQHAEHILRWANSPSVMDDLILHLSSK
ncbi:hypothetical protein KSF_063110 [Reticulibacter mediterranei]|uniref:Uncharacterized protein n=1 Tax=Reticulibacter mediterranei TaxID=2778369 RepID=A0A8J3N594_9CHLR|nr:hypothetical protein [Reticulibacter mediterranei]GHO96263.1 hypothetical protein KSF_063110 [Reticulibacter mediterranei]